MKLFRKCMLTICALGLVLSVSACGKKTESVEERLPDYVYVPEYSEMGDASLYNVKFVEDGIYYLDYSFDEATGQYNAKVCRKDLTEGTVTDIVLPADTNINCFEIASDGAVYGIGYNMYGDDLTGEMNYEQTLMKVDSQGSLVYSIGLKEHLSEDNYISNIMADEKNHIYLMCDNQVLLFDENGSYYGTVDLNSARVSWIAGCGKDKQGNIYISYQGKNGAQLAKLDYDKKTLGETYQNFVSSGRNFCPGLEKDFLCFDETAVYEYDLATQTKQELLTWLDSDISGTYVQGIGVTKDGRIIAAINDWSTNENSIAVLKKTDSSTLKDKEIITVASLYDNMDLQKAAVAFNKNSDSYKIRIKSYINNNDNWTENTWTDAINRLNNDITSGNAADIIDVSMLDYTMLANKGVFEDMNNFLKKSDLLKAEDFLPNILESYTINKTLVAIPKRVYLDTVAGKTSDLGNKMGWSLDEMIAYADAHPQANLFDYASKENMLYYCMSYNKDKFVDWKSGKCDFDSQEFVRLLEFVKRFPSSEDIDYDSSMSTPSRIQNGMVLLNTVYLNSFNEVQLYKAMFGGEVTFIGYPTTDGSVGASMGANDLFAITRKSNHKEGAWAFIESYLSEEMEEDGYGWYSFPTLQKNFDYMKETAIKPQTYTWVDENGEEHEEIANGGSVGFEDNWTYQYRVTTEDEVETVLEIMKVAKPAITQNDQIMTIITEEAQSFFAGDKTAEDVAKVIQNRVSIYVSENS